MMTNAEKFEKGIVVYKTDDDDYICELWEASTKHPDSLFRFSDWKDQTDLFDKKYQVMQWLFYCASQLTFPFHAKQLAKFALENYDI